MHDSYGLKDGLYVSAEGTELKQIIATYLDAEDQAFVCRGMAYAVEKHGPTERKDGKKFYQHPFTVAYYLAENQLDADTLIAALLHDVAEDVEKVTIEDIEADFNSEVAKLVNSVTKIETDSAESAPRRLSKSEQIRVTFNKLFKEMVKDERVILIKLFDRLHNMRTIAPMRRESQLRSATESLEIYAPLAHRLGMWRIKTELETLSLQVVDADNSQFICDRLHRFEPRKRRKLDKTLTAQITDLLEKESLEVIEISPAPRNPYPIYKRAPVKDKYHFAIDNSPRLVIVLEDRAACYQALGAIHQFWKPRVGKFDDFIALPRVNMYRALHTNVTTPDGKVVKLRLRTPAMKRISEMGILAKWKHNKELGASAQKELQVQVAELFESIDNMLQNEDDFYASILDDVLSEQIIVYSPLGDAFLLPIGSTPLDFAYRIHTEVGHTAFRATINDKAAALNTTLHDGDRVAVHLYSEPAPQRHWLNADLGYLNTRSATSKVRKFFKTLDPQILGEDGRRLLLEELDLAGLREYSAETIAELFGYDSAEHFYFDIGVGELLTPDISTRLLAIAWADGDTRSRGKLVTAEDGVTYVIYNASNFGDLTLCKRCKPRPDDPIYGYIDQVIDITVHHEQCPKLLRSESGTNVRLDWGQSREDKTRTVRVDVWVYDRPQLIGDISKVLEPDKVNIDGLKTGDIENGEMELNFMLRVGSPRQLVRILHKIRALVNVHRVRCYPNQRSDKSQSSVSNDY